MSSTEGSQTGGSTEKEVSKEVTVIGYSDDDHQNDSVRDFAAEVTGKPTNKSYTEESTHYEFHAELGGVWDFEGRKISGNYYDEEKADKIVEQLENATDGRVSLVKQVETRELHETTLSQASKQLVSELTEELPDEVNGATRSDMHVGRWQNDVGQRKVNFGSGNWEQMRVLSKEGQREDDNLFETISERPCVRITVDLMGDSEEELDELTKKMVTPVHKALSQKDGIGKVRYMDCKVTTQREGDCYNI